MWVLRQKMQVLQQKVKIYSLVFNILACKMADYSALPIIYELIGSSLYTTLLIICVVEEIPYE
jgi:hypothetical protein